MWVRSLVGLRPAEQGNSNPFQYPCQENPTDTGDWWVIVHEVAEWDMTERLSAHAETKFSYRTAPEDP